MNENSFHPLCLIKFGLSSFPPKKQQSPPPDPATTANENGLLCYGQAEEFLLPPIGPQNLTSSIMSKTNSGSLTEKLFGFSVYSARDSGPANSEHSNSVQPNDTLIISQITITLTS